MKKCIAALSVALTLVGCGSSSDDNSANTSTGSDGNSGTSTELAGKMATVALQDTGTNSDCSANSQTFETTDLVVAYGVDATRSNVEELKNAARLSQVALDELISKTGLDKSAAELDITANNKWTVCFDDNKTGNGSGGVRQLDFSPKNFSDSGYILAKHELFHVFQSALLNNKTAFLHLPRWFQEGSAEYFSGRNVDSVSATTLTRFIDDANITPLSILTWNHEQSVNATYDVYQKSLEYFISRGLTTAQILQLTRDSYRDGQDANVMPAFHTAMASLNFSSPLPVSYNNLRDNVADYRQHIITDWLTTDEYSASFTSVSSSINIGKLIFRNLSTNNEFSGSVNTNQTAYVYNKGILADGNYNVYAINTTDTAAYGPIQQSVTNGELGAIDFSGQPELVE